MLPSFAAAGPAASVACFRRHPSGITRKLKRLEAEAAGWRANWRIDKAFLAQVRGATKNANSVKPAKEPDDHSWMKMPLTRRLGLKNRRIHADWVVDLGILFGERRGFWGGKEERCGDSSAPHSRTVPASGRCLLRIGPLLLAPSCLHSWLKFCRFATEKNICSNAFCLFFISRLALYLATR